MTPLMEIVEGWTGALPFTLAADDTPVDLTGLLIEVVLKNAKGTVIRDSTDGITVTSSTGGALEYAPVSSSEFMHNQSPYRIRFRVTDVASNVVYHPNDGEDLIKVYRV